jgi:hypothetical protein
MTTPNTYIFTNINKLLQVGSGYNYKSTKMSSNQPFSNSIKDKFVKYGWRKGYIYTHLKHLRDELIEDYNENEIITGFSFAWYNSNTITFTTTTMPTPTSSTTQNPKNISSVFYSIGLKNSISKHLETVLEPLCNTCYTDIQLIEIGIEYIVGKYKPIKDKGSNYLYENERNVWFSVPNIKTIKVMNIEYDCATNQNKNIYFTQSILQHIKQIQGNKKNHTLFYHTTGWRFFRSISKNIRHSSGRRCLDFGFTTGFYITDQLNTALEWGKKKGNLFYNEKCMFIFSIPEKKPKYLKYKHLQNDEWREIVKLSRKCIDDIHTIDDDDFDTINNIDNYDLIYGDVVSNPFEIKNGKEPKTHNPTKTQLVSKTTNGDAYLQKHLIGCIFFNKTHYIIHH